MIQRAYTGICNASNVDGQLRAMGLVKGSRFFGVTVDIDPNNPRTLVHVADDFSPAECLVADNALEASFPQRSFTPPDLPMGFVIEFNRLFGAVPSSYSLCDGTNGTPDLRSSFANVTETVYE